MAPLPDAFEKRFKLGQISLPQSGRVDEQFRQRFQPLEKRHVAEWKVELRRIENVKQNDFVPAMAKVLQTGQQRVDVVEEVAEYDHDAAFFKTLGQVVKDRA